MNKQDIIENICSLIILNIASKREVETSYLFRNLFLNSLGIIVDEKFLIEELASKNLVEHNGIFNNSSFYKSIVTTDQGVEYFEEEIKKVIVPEGEFTEERERRIKTFLGI